MESKRKAVCTFCYRHIKVVDEDHIPPPESEEWIEIEEEFGHKDDCEWVINRAYQKTS